MEFRIKSNRDRGNDIGNFVFKDITMEDVEQPIVISEFYPKIPKTIVAAPLTRLTPHFHDITLRKHQGHRLSRGDADRRIAGVANPACEDEERADLGAGWSDDSVCRCDLRSGLAVKAAQGQALMVGRRGEGKL